MTKYNISQIDKHIQRLMRFMQDEYPNNYEIVIGPAFAEIRNTQTEMAFIREDMKQENIRLSESEVKQTVKAASDFLNGLFPGTDT